METVQMPGNSIREEFKLENFKFSNVHDSLMSSFQWRLNKRCVGYLIYRWVTMATVLALSVYYLILEERENPGGVWMVYATNWSLLLLFLTSLVMAVNSTKFVVRQEYLDSSHRSPSILSQAEWFLYSSSQPIQLTVTVAFWSFIYSFAYQKSPETLQVARDSQIKHSVFSVYVLLEIWLNCVPVRILHVVYPLFFSLFYVVFNAIYFRNQGVSPYGSPYAYHLVDWRTPGVAIATCAAVVAILITMHFLLFAIYRLKLMIFWKTVGSRNDEEWRLIKPDDVSDATNDAEK